MFPWVEVTPQRFGGTITTTWLLGVANAFATINVLLVKIAFLASYTFDYEFVLLMITIIG
jgi:hypothetical protein